MEITRLWTYITHKKLFLEAHEQEILSTNPALAYQVRQYCLERGHCDEVHIKRLTRLARTPRFTGSLKVRKHRDIPVSRPAPPSTHVTDKPMADEAPGSDSGPDTSDDGLTDADASGDDDDEVLEWFVTLVDVAADK
ncbi:hypothetical protein C8J56DRAFT_1051185 [Mycena floridula]|nr:hypothetical protein C8J56DRAFT_1051185 [Mycena floridula]